VPLALLFFFCLWYYGQLGSFLRPWLFFAQETQSVEEPDQPSAPSVAKDSTAAADENSAVKNSFKTYLESAKHFASEHPYVTAAAIAALSAALAGLAYYCFYHSSSLPPPEPPFIADHSHKFDRAAAETRAATYNYYKDVEGIGAASVRESYFPESVRRAVPNIHLMYPNIHSLLHDPWGSLPNDYKLAILANHTAPYEWAAYRYQVYSHYISMYNETFHPKILGQKLPFITWVNRFPHGVFPRPEDWLSSEDTIPLANFPSEFTPPKK
jgi:hypothetical protein